MNLPNIINELRVELANVEKAIESLQKLTANAKRRGRPPLWSYQNGGPKIVAKAYKVQAAGAGARAEGASGAD